MERGEECDPPRLPFLCNGVALQETWKRATESREEASAELSKAAIESAMISKAPLSPALFRSAGVVGVEGGAVRPVIGRRRPGVVEAAPGASTNRPRTGKANQHHNRWRVKSAEVAVAVAMAAAAPARATTATPLVLLGKLLKLGNNTMKFEVGLLAPNARKRHTRMPPSTIVRMLSQNDPDIGNSGRPDGHADAIPVSFYPPANHCLGD